VKNGIQVLQGVRQIKFGNLNIFIKKSNMEKIILSEIHRIKEVMGIISEAPSGFNPGLRALQRFFEEMGFQGGSYIERSALESVEKTLEKDLALSTKFEQIGTKLADKATEAAGLQELKILLKDPIEFGKLFGFISS
jgi:hypothetical protein